MTSFDTEKKEIKLLNYIKPALSVFGFVRGQHQDTYPDSVLAWNKRNNSQNNEMVFLSKKSLKHCMWTIVISC